MLKGMESSQRRRRGMLAACTVLSLCLLLYVALLALYWFPREDRELPPADAAPVTVGAQQLVDRRSWMLSYPRSGSHLLRTIIENATGYNTKSIYHQDQYPLAPSHDYHHPSSVEGWYKVHQPWHQFRWIYPSPWVRPWRLILLIRDPYEAISSDAGFMAWPLRMITSMFFLRKYLSAIDYYHHFTGPKSLIYYEDLTRADPETLDVLGRALASMGEGWRKSGAALTPEAVLEICGVPVLGIGRKPKSTSKLHFYRANRALGVGTLLVPLWYKGYLGRYESLAFWPAEGLGYVAPPGGDRVGITPRERRPSEPGGAVQRPASHDEQLQKVIKRYKKTAELERHLEHGGPEGKRALGAELRVEMEVASEIKGIVAT